MSVYNGEEFLAEAIESVLGQTLADFEFVIINDGSTDRTAEILSDYARRDSRVRVFQQQNEGRAEALNRGIGLATAPLIARMDADDVSLPHRLKEQVGFMTGRPEVGLLGSPVEFIGPDGRRIGDFRPPLQDGEIRAAMRRHNVFYHPTVMMRKETAVAAGGYRKPLRDADDYDLFLRIGERSQMASLARPVLLYRIHVGQATVRNMIHQVECGLAARAAASFRVRGAPDPLCSIDEVSPELLRSLGVAGEDVQRAELCGCAHWVPLLAHADSDAALQLIDRLLALCNSVPGERSAAASALMQAASIHYRRGRLGDALVNAGRGILAQPLIAGRHLRMAMARRVGWKRGHSTRTSARLKSWLDESDANR